MTDFDIIWAQYPRKTAKSVARKAWSKLNPDAVLVQRMIDALTWQCQTDQWKRGIIPHMSTWLNQARYDDEPLIAVGRVPTGTTKQQEALARINSLVSQGMDRRQAILQVENALWPSPDPHVH